MFNNNILSNFDINKMLAGSKTFKGVYSIDKLTKLRKSKDWSMIINLEPSYKQGSHWVALFNSPKNKFTYYFDSFGFPPPDEITLKYRPIKFNSHPIQHTKSSACGYYAVYFIKQMEKGIDYLQFIYKFEQKFNSMKNEKIIEKLKSSLI
jgi:hypothetical protein